MHNNAPNNSLIAKVEVPTDTLPDTSNPIPGQTSGAYQVLDLKQPIASGAHNRILMVNRPNALTHPGGDAVMLDQLRSHARQLKPDLDIDLSLNLHPSAEGYDLVHVFNLLCPYWTLPQLDNTGRIREW